MIIAVWEKPYELLFWLFTSAHFWMDVSKKWSAEAIIFDVQTK